MIRREVSFHSQDVHRDSWLSQESGSVRTDIRSKDQVSSSTAMDISEQYLGTLSIGMVGGSLPIKPTTQTAIFSAMQDTMNSNIDATTPQKISGSKRSRDEIEAISRGQGAKRQQ